MKLYVILRRLTVVTGIVVVGGSLAFRVLGAELPAGVATMEVRITESDEEAPIETVVSFLIPIDGEDHEFQRGRQMAVQTRVNSVVAVLFLDATTRVTARLIPYQADSEPVMHVQGHVNDVHIMEELGIPFVLAEDSLLDTLRCEGNWFVRNGQEREICSSAREGVDPKSWTVTMTLRWQVTEGADELDLNEITTTEATMLVSSRTGNKRQSVSCDGLPSQGTSSCESQHGKQVPLVTVANDARTTQYVDATTRISLEVHEDGRSELVMMDTTIEPPPSVQKIDLGVLGTARALYTVPSGTSSLDHLRVGKIEKTGEGEVSITLEKYRRIGAMVAAR